MTYKYQQLLVVAEAFIRRQMSGEKVKEYERLKRKIEVGTPMKSSSATKIESSSTKKKSRIRIESQTDRKITQPTLRTTDTLRPSKNQNEFIESIIVDLKSIRQKVLRRQYGRKTLRQISLKTRQAHTGVDQTLSGQVKLSLQRIILALDIQTLKVKEQLVDRKDISSDQLSKVHKDNKWLIQQVQSLIHQNQRLKGQSTVGFIKHRKF